MSRAFTNWAEFWEMGGYAFYVWLAVSTTLLLLLILTFYCIRQHKTLLRTLCQQEKRVHRLNPLNQRAPAVTEATDESSS